MEDNASNVTPDNEPAINLADQVHLDGNSIISTPDKLHLDNDMPSIDNLGLTTTTLSVLSEKDEIDFLGSSAKTLHKTISDYVDQNFSSHQDQFLAQCYYERSPLLKYRNNDKTAKRQKPIKDPTGKSKPTTKQPTQGPCPIQICRPGYKSADKRTSGRRNSAEDVTSEKPSVEPFKASIRSFEFKPSALTLVDSGPIKIRKIQRTGAKPEPFKGNVKGIKENKSSKLRSEYNRKQGTIPSHMQEYVNKYKKPPFRKAIPHPNACFEDIIERLQKLKKLVPNAPNAPSLAGKGPNPSSQAGNRTAKSRKPKKAKKRTI